MSDQAKSSGAPLMLSVSGCRGIVGSSLTAEVICRFASAAALWLGESSARAASRHVVLASDGRRGGDVLRRIAGGALASCGWRVSDIGVATTPTVGVMVDALGAAGGLTLTASHNPEPWNGIKVVDGTGAAPDAANAAKIIEHFKAGRGVAATPDRFGAIEAHEGAAQVHVGRVMDALASVADVDAIRRRRFKVVVDSVNASGAEGARLLVETLGCRVTHLFADGSGVFPHTPEPTAENLAGLTSMAGREGADVCFAQDPDADRLAILDGAGRYIGEEYTLVLAAMAILGSARAPKSAALAANLSTSRMIDDVAQRFGATVRRSAVGEANVVAAMRTKPEALMGGEGNGGVIWPKVCWIRDSVGAMALVLGLLEREKRTLAEIVKSAPAYAIEKRKMPVREGLASSVLRAAERSLGSRRGAKVDRQDGVRVDLPVDGGMGWVHVRSSNTEPIVRLIAEAPSAGVARTLLDEIERAV